MKKKKTTEREEYSDRRKENLPETVDLEKCFLPPYSYEHNNIQYNLASDLHMQKEIPTFCTQDRTQMDIIFIQTMLFVNYIQRSI